MITHHYCCVVIPKSVDINGVWNVLPPGVHPATLQEIEKRFATNAKRRALFDGFCRAVDALRKAGCTAIFLDGSFVTARSNKKIRQGRVIHDDVIGAGLQKIPAKDFRLGGRDGDTHAFVAGL